MLREGDARLAHAPSRRPILVHLSVSLSPSASFSIPASFFLFIYLSVPAYVSVEALSISSYTSPSTVSHLVTGVYLPPISQKTVKVS